MPLRARAYYNEHDPFAAEWLRMLILTGEIAEGDVDERSIEDVQPLDLAGYTQCHFFAGIGGWSCALRLAGWPDSRAVWTGSCPCQPFSAAGKGGGFDDERHLWPVFFHLIATCRPVRLFGEQVASKPGLAWFDLVYSDLEAAGYSTRAVDICAAGIGAPHIRQRLYFGAYSNWSTGLSVMPQQAERARIVGLSAGDNNGAYSVHAGRPERRTLAGNRQVAGSCESGNGSDSPGRFAGNGDLQRGGEYGLLAEAGCAGYSNNPILPRLEGLAGDERGPGWLSRRETRSIAAAGATRGFWGDADWWHGRDEKFRPIEPGLFPLVNGVSGRVGKLRGYGNAIVPPLAAEFIQAWEASIDA